MYQPAFMIPPNINPYFIPLGFEVDWVGLIPLYFILYMVLTHLGFTCINWGGERKHRFNR